MAGCKTCKSRTTCEECQQDPACVDKKMRVLFPGEDKCVDCAYDPDLWFGYYFDAKTCRKCLGPTDITCDICDDTTNCKRCIEPKYFLMVGSNPRNCQTCRWDNEFYHQQRGHFGVIVSQNPKTLIDHSNYYYPLTKLNLLII